MSYVLEGVDDDDDVDVFYGVDNTFPQRSRFKGLGCLGLCSIRIEGR